MQSHFIGSVRAIQSSGIYEPDRIQYIFGVSQVGNVDQIAQKRLQRNPEAPRQGTETTTYSISPWYTRSKKSLGTVA